jgi:hypothetical protein
VGRGLDVQVVEYTLQYIGALMVNVCPTLALCITGPHGQENVRSYYLSFSIDRISWLLGRVSWYTLLCFRQCELLFWWSLPWYGRVN